MPDTDPYKQYADTRTSLRDTAKWIVTIVGATVVLVVGGGLIAKIADLDLLPRLIASGSLLALAFICKIPLKGAIDIVATRVTPLPEMVESPDFATARQIVDATGITILASRPSRNCTTSIETRSGLRTTLDDHNRTGMMLTASFRSCNRGFGKS